MAMKTLGRAGLVAMGLVATCAAADGVVEIGVAVDQGNSARLAAYESSVMVEHVQNRSTASASGSGMIRTLRVLNANGRVRVFIDSTEISPEELHVNDVGTLGWINDHVANFAIPIDASDPHDLFVRGTSSMATVAEPPTMIGIHHSVPGPILEMQLGLAENSTTMITGICEGLPADRAGITEYDIIVGIAGEMQADPPAVLRAIAGTTPGTPLTLNLFSRGELRDVEVEVEQYDAQRFITSTVLGQPSTSGQFSEESYFVAPGGLQFVGHGNVLQSMDLTGDAVDVAARIRQRLLDRRQFSNDGNGFDGIADIGISDPAFMFEGLVLPETEGMCEGRQQPLSRLLERLSELEARVLELEALLQAYPDRRDR